MSCALTTVARLGLLPVLATLGLLSGCEDAPEHIRSEATRPNAVAQGRADTTQPADTAQPADAVPDITPDTLADAPPTDTALPDTASPDADTGAETGLDTDADLDTGSDTDLGPDAGPDVGPDVTPTPAGPVLYPPGRVHSPITADLAERLRTLAAIDPSLQDDVFMKVGASSMVSNSFLKCFAGNFDLAAFTHLEPARAFFLAGDAAGTNPFSRTSLAAESGRSAIWAISGDPSPMEREYLATSPRFAFVMYGANDMHRSATIEASLFPFAENLWTLVDELLAWGVTPVLMTIGRRLDNTTADRWVQTYNSVIRGLAQGRGLPFVDLFLAYSPLPNFGVSSDGLHANAFSGGACILTEQGLQFGHNMRNRHLLENLSRLEAVVVDHVAALDEDAPRLDGDGSPAAPFEIPFLPFTDMRSTLDSPHSNLDVYTGCGAAQNERGPEWLYRVEVASRVRIRATVHDLGDTDIDLHLLDHTATAAGCLQRNHRIIDATLDPGVYHFALDTFVSAAGPRGGEYLFTVIDCDATPPGCQ